MDAITSITNRISFIEAQLAAVRAGSWRGGGATAAATANGHAFAQTLASVGAGTTAGSAGLGSAGLGAAGLGAAGLGAAGLGAAGLGPGLGAGIGAGRTQLNSKGVPVDLAAYGNGRIPASALSQVGDTRHKLWAPAAGSLTRLIADARRDGVNIGITDSYRSYAEQVDLAKRKGLYAQGGLAAKPGTSDHGWGMAVDLDLNPQAQAWMRANGTRYGFVEDTPREPWHWAYQPRV